MIFCCCGSCCREAWVCNLKEAGLAGKGGPECWRSNTDGSSGVVVVGGWVPAVDVVVVAAAVAVAAVVGFVFDAAVVDDVDGVDGVEVVWVIGFAEGVGGSVLLPTEVLLAFVLVLVLVFFEVPGFFQDVLPVVALK
jgi:hypothetical protein